MSNVNYNGLIKGHTFKVIIAIAQTVISTYITWRVMKLKKIKNMKIVKSSKVNTSRFFCIGSVIYRY